MTDSRESYEIRLPEFKSWKISQVYDYAENIADYSSLEELGTAITKARISLFKLTEQINAFDRKERLAKLEYEREFRREYLASSEKTEAAKRARAELRCEGLENAWLVNEQVRKELERAAYSVRMELQTLQTAANNLRQQLRIL